MKLKVLIFEWYETDPCGQTQSYSKILALVGMENGTKSLPIDGDGPKKDDLSDIAVEKDVEDSLSCISVESNVAITLDRPSKILHYLS